MKKNSQNGRIVPSMSLVVLCLFILISILLPIANTTAYAILKDPHTSRWDDSGSSNPPPEKEEISVYVNKYMANELTYFSLEGTNDSDNDKAYSLDSYDYVDSRILISPGTMQTYNNIDYVIFMTKTLENLAEKYLSSCGEEITNQKIKNLVLGYVRGINKKYYEESDEGNWKMVAGPIDSNFIAYVKKHDNPGTQITALEFFASFLQDANLYNKSVYGEIDSKFLNKHYNLKDPLGSKQSIDLIHMFASMDGIFQATEQNAAATTAIGNIQRPLASWLGDLHSFANSLKNIDEDNFITYKNYDPSMGHIDFNEQVNNDSKEFSSCDLLADIDSYNLTTFFLNNRYNSFSSSLATYYNETSQDANRFGNRYSQFIFSTTFGKDNLGQSPALKRFQRAVFWYMNLTVRDDGSIEEYDYFKLSSITDSIILKILNNNGMPSAEIRIYCAKLFYDYIIAMSSYV